LRACQIRYCRWRDRVYQQQEIFDLTNLLRVLVDVRQDIPLAGVLRSPPFNFSDDQVCFTATDAASASEEADFDRLETTLWEIYGFMLITAI
jgi:ATP-dependent exoDNAse (exonuclease V) beta subunit